MHKAKFEKVKERVEELLDGASPEQLGRLAGEVLSWAGVSRETLAVMLGELEPDDLWEISEQVPDLVNELVADSDKNGDDDG